MRLIIFVVSIALLAISCANMSAGGGTDNPNSFTGVVAYEDGSIASGAVVRVIHKDDWLFNIEQGLSVIVDSMVVDSTGWFLLEVPDTGKYTIEVEAPRGGLLRYGQRPFQGEILTVAPWIHYSGKVESTEKPEALLFGSSSFRAAVKADNSFEIARIPQGTYPVITLTPKGGALESQFLEMVNISGDGALQDTLIIVPDTLLVDDFSFGFLHTSLGTMSNGFWYDFCDKYEPFGGNSDVIWDTISNGAAWNKGPSFLCYIQVREGFDNPFGGVGFFIGNYDTYYNLSKVNKLVFMGKGKGTIRVSFETHALDTLTNNTGHFGTIVTMPNTWSPIEIELDSLTLSPESQAYWLGYTWDMVSDRVNRIEFGVYGTLAIPGETIELWLDDIKLSDIQLKDLK